MNLQDIEHELKLSRQKCFPIFAMCKSNNKFHNIYVINHISKVIGKYKQHNTSLQLIVPVDSIRLITKMLRRNYWTFVRWIE